MLKLDGMLQKKSICASDGCEVITKASYVQDRKRVLLMAVRRSSHPLA